MISASLTLAPAYSSDSVEQPGIYVAGIKFGDSRQKVLKQLGEPEEAGPTECDGCIDIIDNWFVYNGLRVHFLQTEAFQFEVTSSSYRLNTGVGVGSTKAEVIDAYGEPSEIPFEGKVVVWYPLSFREQVDDRFKLEFLIENDVVIAFQVGPRRTGSSFP